MKPCPLTVSETEFVRTHYKNYTPKDMVLSLNKVRRVAKLPLLKVRSIAWYIKTQITPNETSLDTVRPPIPQREKGRPTKKQLSEAVDSLYADCSQVDVLSPELTILDEPSVPPVKTHRVDSDKEGEAV